MEHTQSATELMPVAIEPNGSGGADIWLNRNITTVEVPLDDGGTQTMWQAEQVHYVSSDIPTAQEIEANFDEVWNEHVGTPSMSVDELADALAELSELDSDNTVMLAETMDALAELSELVSELMGGGDE